jgi:hypothetical protein
MDTATLNASAANGARANLSTDVSATGWLSFVSLLSLVILLVLLTGDASY